MNVLALLQSWKIRKPCSSRRLRRPPSDSPIVIVAEVLEVRALLSSGALDTRFGSGGSVSLPAGSQAYAAEAIQSDGKILAAGRIADPVTNDFDLSIVRYNANGTLDTSFGNGGSVTTAMSPGGKHGTATNAEINAIAVESDGTIVAAGLTNNYSAIVVAMYNPNGTLDTSFNGTGIAVEAYVPPRHSTITSASLQANAVVIQADGKIVVGGLEILSYSNGTTQRFAVVDRFNRNGTLDTTFASGGQDIIADPNPANAYPFQVNGLTIDPSTQNIIAVGQLALASGKAAFTLELTPNGAFNSSFGTNGLATYAGDGSTQNAKAVAIQNVNGVNDIVVAGSGEISGGPENGGGLLLLRYTPSGSLDTTFGTNGVVNITAIPEGSWPNGHFLSANTMTLAADGSIITGGTYGIPTGGGDYFAVAKFTPNGALDATFSNSTSPFAGLVLGLPTDGNGDGINALGIEPLANYDYDIVALGYTGTAGGALQAWDPPLAGSAATAASTPVSGWAEGAGSLDAVAVADASGQPYWGDTIGTAVKTDSAGNVYMAGTFDGTVNFAPLGAVSSSTVTTLSSDTTFSHLGPMDDVFVAKYNPAGQLIWVDGFGSAAEDKLTGLALDSSGNVYITGTYIYYSIMFGATTLTSPGDDGAMYVAKLDTNGAVVWATGTTGAEGTSSGASAIALDGSGNAFVVGNVHGATTFGGMSLPGSGGSNRSVFVTEVDAVGNFVWANEYDATQSASLNGIAVDSAGNAYLTGNYVGTLAFDGSHSLTSSKIAGNPAQDILAVKLDQNGNVVWDVTMGSGVGYGNAVTVDGSGNVYLAGGFGPSQTISRFTTANFNPHGTYNLKSAGLRDAYVVKLDTNSNFVWAKDMGGSGDDMANAITLDAAGNVYTTGTFNGTADFDPGKKAYDLTSGGSIAMFVSKLDANGNFVWAVEASGPASNLKYNYQVVGLGIAVDGSGNVYTTGSYSGTPTLGSSNLQTSGETDYYYGYGQNWAFLWQITQP